MRGASRRGDEESCFFAACADKHAVFENSTSDITKHLKGHRLSLAGKTTCACRLPDGTACELRLGDGAAKLVANTKKTSSDMKVHVERIAHGRWLLDEAMLKEHEEMKESDTFPSFPSIPLRARQ